MKSFNEALSVANNYLKKKYSSDDNPPIIVLDHTIENDLCWIFFYNSKYFVETGDRMYAYVGNAPIVVFKEIDKMLLIPTYIRDHEKYVYSQWNEGLIK